MTKNCTYPTYPPDPTYPPKPPPTYPTLPYPYPPTAYPADLLPLPHLSQRPTYPAGMGKPGKPHENQKQVLRRDWRNKLLRQTGTKAVTHAIPTSAAVKSSQAASWRGSRRLRP